MAYSRSPFLKLITIARLQSESLRNICTNYGPRNHLLYSKDKTQIGQYTPRRGLGWLLSSTLRPGQKGYEYQQKMRKRALVVFGIFTAILWPILYKFKLVNFGNLASSEHMYSMMRDDATEIKAKVKARDEHMLRLAELRKKNAELYPPIKFEEKNDSSK